MKSRALPGHAVAPWSVALARLGLVTTALGVLIGVAFAIIALPAWLSFSVAIMIAGGWCAWVDTSPADVLLAPCSGRAPAAPSRRWRRDAQEDCRGC